MLQGVRSINGEEYRAEDARSFNIALFRESIKDEVTPEELQQIQAEHADKLKKKEADCDAAKAELAATFKAE